jgi:hypothetical protein
MSQLINFFLHKKCLSFPLALPPAKLNSTQKYIMSCHNQIYINMEEKYQLIFTIQCPPLIKTTLNNVHGLILILDKHNSLSNNIFDTHDFKTWRSKIWYSGLLFSFHDICHCNSHSMVYYFTTDNSSPFVQISSM